MQAFRKLFTKKTSVIGMIHVDPLPGTPSYKTGSFNRLMEKAKHEASIYSKSDIDAILIENMHDIPYVKSSKFGPETVASMTAVVKEVQRVLQGEKRTQAVGVQVLACGGKEAVAIARSTGCSFIRNEGFVFSHIGDEGFIDSNAGELLRYRKAIDAEEVLIFSDIKKKHSSHSITFDVSLLETAFAAQFFKADGLILTGKSTGDETDLDELRTIRANQSKLQLPILVGSGVTKENLSNYVGLADALIIGSYFKRDGHWANDLDQEKIQDFMGHLTEILK